MLVDFLSCIDCVDGVCSACVEINTAITDPSPIANGVVHYVEEVDHNDEFIVYKLDNHDVDMDVTHRAFVGHGEVVEHDAMHQLTIVRTVEETPPLKPHNLEIDLSTFLTMIF